MQHLLVLNLNFFSRVFLYFLDLDFPNCIYHILFFLIARSIALLITIVNGINIFQ